MHLRYIYPSAEKIIPSFLLGPKFITDVISMPEAGKNTVVQAMLRVAISENTKMNK